MAFRIDNGAPPHEIMWDLRPRFSLSTNARRALARVANVSPLLSHTCASKHPKKEFVRMRASLQRRLGRNTRPSRRPSMLVDGLDPQVGNGRKARLPASRSAARREFISGQRRRPHLPAAPRDIFRETAGSALSACGRHPRPSPIEPRCIACRRPQTIPARH
jgi:hypothetical protein